MSSSRVDLIADTKTKTGIMIKADEETQGGVIVN